MRIDSGFDYPGAQLDEVFAMLVDPEFQRQRCAATGALESSVEISGDPCAPLVRCRRRMATDGVADFVRRVVGSSVEVLDELAWALATGPDVRTADVHLTFAGQPTSMTGRLEVRSDRTGTRGVLTGDLKGGIPFIGGRIENATAPFILNAMASEESLGRRWLAK